MFMKDAAFLEQLQQEIPRRNLSPKATQRFEDTYKMLGVQKEAPVRRRRHKGLWITAATACLCCGMLFGVNAAFPAFAESLPGVGRFFENLNGGFTFARNNKAAHGANLDTYDTQDVDVFAVAENGSAQLEISQAYSDGQRLSFTLDVTLPVNSHGPFFHRRRPFLWDDFLCFEYSFGRRGDRPSRVLPARFERLSPHHRL